jgi:hypothetical protein
MSLLHKGNSIFSISTNNGFLSFLFEMQSTAQIVDQVLDSQKTVDTRIRTTCQKLIDESTHRLSQRVEQLRDHLPDIEKPTEPSDLTAGVPLKRTEEAHPTSSEEAAATNQETQPDQHGKLLQTQIQLLIDDLREEVNRIRAAMTLYLSNEETEFILFKPIKSRILKSLETLEKQVRLVFNEEQLFGIQLSANSWIKMVTQFSSSNV